MLRFVQPIWHVRGSIDLAPGQSIGEAFDRLDPLFQQTGTSRERIGDTLTFSKKDPDAQDRMAVFDSGVLRIEQGVSGPELRYRLISRTLLFCFLAPLLFLAFAGVTVGLGKLQKPPTAAEKAKEEAAKKRGAAAMNPVDIFLGAPAPDKKGEKGKEDDPDERKKPSPTPAYVFAGLFAALYAAGRVLEARVVRSLFRKTLQGG